MGIAEVNKDRAAGGTLVEDYGIGLSVEGLKLNKIGS